MSRRIGFITCTSLTHGTYIPFVLGSSCGSRRLLIFRYKFKDLLGFAIVQVF